MGIGQFKAQYLARRGPSVLSEQARRAREDERKGVE
jgi:hypothetical protein